MGHYELLGVTPDASTAEIKRNYLALASTSHPDHHGSSETARRSAEERMRSLNEAWAVLGDVDERSVYDRQRLREIRDTQQAATRPGSPHHRTTAAHEAYRRFDDNGDDGFDERHDSPITPSSLPQWLALTPAFLLIGGLAGLLLGSVVNATALVVGGLISVIVAGVLFVVAAPIVALGRSARDERLN